MKDIKELAYYFSLNAMSVLNVHVAPKETYIFTVSCLFHINNINEQIANKILKDENFEIKVNKEKFVNYYLSHKEELVKTAINEILQEGVIDEVVSFLEYIYNISIKNIEPAILMLDEISNKKLSEEEIEKALLYIFYRYARGAVSDVKKSEKNLLMKLNDINLEVEGLEALIENLVDAFSPSSRTLEAIESIPERIKKAPETEIDFIEIINN